MPLSRGALLLCIVALSALAAPPAHAAHRGAMHVTSDSGAGSFAALGWLGSGTAADPYHLPAGTTVVAPSSGFAIEISGTISHVNLSGLTIAGGGSSSDGIHVFGARNVTVWGNTLETDRVGIHIKSSSGIVVGANTVKTSQVGVYLESATNVTLRDNRILLNDKDVELRGSRANTLVRNNLSVATGQFGLHFDDNVSYANRIDTTNVVNAIPVRWYTDLVGTEDEPVVISAPTVDLPRITNVAQIMVHNGSHVRLASPVAKAGYASGIHVSRSVDVALVHPTAEGNGANGLFVELSNDTRIDNASARLNGASGALLQSANDARVEWSTFTANTLAAVRATASGQRVGLDNLTLAGNAGGGIVVSATGNASITGNALTSNGATEISLDGAHTALVAHNTITGSGTTAIALARSDGRVALNHVTGHANGIGLSSTSGTIVAENDIALVSGAGISFAASAGNNVTANAITLARGGYGFAFDAPASYDNGIAPTNLVNGTAVRWYTNVVGPVTLDAVRVEVAGITNVGQILLYRSSNVTLTNATAGNGTGAGIVVYASPDANLSGATIRSSRGQGVLAVASHRLKVLASTIEESGSDGAKVTGSDGVLFENTVVEDSGARGIALDAGSAPTFRGNAITGSAGVGLSLDLVSPGGAAADNNLFEGNAGGGIVAARSKVGSFHANTLVSNGADGIALSSVAAGAILDANHLTDHTRGVRLTASSGIVVTANTIVKSASQTGLHFDDETSYNATIPTSNTVNGIPVRWYNGATHETIEGAAVELAGITNVAQVMVFRSDNVTLAGAAAANGTSRGIYVLASQNVTVDDARSSGNARAGLHVDRSRDVSVLGSDLSGNAQEGAFIHAAPATRIANTTIQQNAAKGVSIDGSAAPGARLENLSVVGNRVGIGVASSAIALLDGNDVRSNGPVGIALATATLAQMTNNSIAGHTRGVELAATQGASIRENGVTIGANQTGWFFADLASYNNTVGPTNLVNGVPMRWYAGESGLVLDDVRAEVRGMTNVAQVMLYRSHGATVTRLHAANGTARGLYIDGSSGVTVQDSRLDNNTLSGAELLDAPDAGVTNVTSRDNGEHGLKASGAGPITVAGSTFAGNAGSGASIEGIAATILDTLAERNDVSGLRTRGATALNVTGATIRDNTASGLHVEAAASPQLFDNDVRSNGPLGLLLDAATGAPRVAGNVIADQTRDLEIRATEFARFDANALVIQPGQTGLWFTDERSYNNLIPTNNTVNGQPVHWYTTLAGSQSEPYVVTGVRSELRGVTNVAQVMIYRSSYVEMPDLVATNGSARGVYVYRSSSVRLEGANVSHATLYGVHLQSTQSSTVRDLDAQGSGTGVQLTDSPNNVIERVNATGGGIGVVLADAASRDNRVQGIEANGTARGVRDASWNGASLVGNNLVADAGSVRRAKAGANVTFSDTTVTYRLENDRVASQTWSFGDGSPDVVSASAILLRPTHAYAEEGRYQADLTVLTQNGLTLVDGVLVEIVPPLSSPRNVDTEPGARNVTLTWSVPSSDGASPITKYRVFRGSNASNVVMVAEVSGSTFRYVDTSLANGQRYRYEVAAVNAEGEGPASSASATPIAAPDAPLHLAATIGPGSVTLSWSAPADTGGSAIRGYELLRATSGTALGVVATLGNVTTTTQAGLTNGVSYTFALRAFNHVGTGLTTANVTATPLGSPTPPRNLRVLAGDASATLVWSAPSDNGGTNVTGYHLWRGGANGTLAMLPAFLPAGTTKFRDDGLSNGETYLYAVTAVNAVGDGNKTSPVTVVPTAVDALRPVVFDRSPDEGDVLAESPTEIRAQYVDNAGIALDSVYVYIDGAQVGANVTDTGFVYALPSALDRGEHAVRVVARDATGNEADERWTFRIVGLDELVPRFDVFGAAIAPDHAAPGENVTARVTVTNVGYAAGNASAILRLGDNALASAEAPLASGDTVELFLPFAAPTTLGAYNLTLGDAVLTLVVEEPAEDNATETPEANETPEPTPEGPRRPTRSTPPPRATSEKGVPFPGAVTVAALVALVALRRRKA
ncbi:MAG TPA: right-handed parallel beta-helix repeat-containing protein [Candidatus Thermoplasmatota archaeon]|nr:right-handed parallel beta-helix repeat-containing protein [Candidatus Thermoplasmatota archaeon]